MALRQFQFSDAFRAVHLHRYTSDDDDNDNDHDDDDDDDNDNDNDDDDDDDNDDEGDDDDMPINGCRKYFQSLTFLRAVDKNRPGYEEQRGHLLLCAGKNMRPAHEQTHRLQKLKK